VKKWGVITVKLNNASLRQRQTICSYPWLINCVRALSYSLLRLRGWRLPESHPESDKYVLIIAPHTSNWDFFLMVAVASGLRRQIRFMGKHQLFVGPLGVLLRWLGGMAVERSSHHNFVAQMAELFAKTDDMVLILAPEGTRSKVSKWKGGYYHIAASAGVPIIAAALDYATKKVSLSSACIPRGDLASDQAELQAFYLGITAKRPHLDSSHPKKV
jgi:1-acyl-sn-glycerol-3-phosphate acyltransferase